MQEIGGYLELELYNNNNIPRYYPNSYLLNSGRHALEFILKGIANLETLYISYFTCEVILEPLKRMGVNYKFYEINKQLEIKDNHFINNLKQNEYILYTNYFGIKGEYIDSLIDVFDKTKIIIDTAQSMFYFNKNADYIFYSPRKFIGIPDGGIALIKKNNNYNQSFTQLEKDYSDSRCEHLERIEHGAEFGYSNFKKNTLQISKVKLKSMSELTKSIINNSDMDYIKGRRRENSTCQIWVIILRLY